MSKKEKPSFAERMIVGYDLLKAQIGKDFIEVSLCNEQGWGSPSYIILGFQKLATNEYEKDGPKTYLKLMDNGQACCELRYITTDDNMASLIPNKFLGFDLKDGSQDGYNEILFFELETKYSTVTFATHNEHNGYYGGFNLVVEPYEKRSE